WLGPYSRTSESKLRCVLMAQLLSALGTKPGLAFDALAALRTRGRCRKPRPALLTELTANTLRAALRAVRDGFRVDIRNLIRRLCLLPNLFLRDGRLRRGTFFLNVGRAGFTKSSLRIPAILRADPKTASGALFEVRSHLLDG